MSNNFKELAKKIKNKRAKIAVLGLGYVGLLLAVSLAKKGFQVIGIEISKHRLNHIKRRESYITDVAGKELKKLLASGKFSATDDPRVLKNIDVVIICVPTPLHRRLYPDLTFVKQAARSIAKNIRGVSLIIVESTVYPGATEEVVLPILEKRNLKHGKDFYLCYSPERIDPANKIFTIVKITKLVGGLNKKDAYLGKLVYKSIISEVFPVSSPKVAETAKLLENTFRLVNIGLIDELAKMSSKMNIDIWEVIEAAGTKPFGFMPFYPGPGVGGHCICKDPLYLYWRAKKSGFKSRFIKLASDITAYMPEYVVDRVTQLLNKKRTNLKNAKILVLGVTYKKDVEDLRKSPALDIIEILQKKNIKVSLYDPMVAYLKINNIDLKRIDLKKEKLKKFDCVIIATDHSKVNYNSVLKNSKRIFDTRNVYKNINDKKVVRL